MYQNNSTILEWYYKAGAKLGTDIKTEDLKAWGIIPQKD